jgi:hypothetical protein
MSCSFLDCHMPEPSILVLLGMGLLVTNLATRKRSFIFDFVHRRFAHVHGVLVGLLPRKR